MTTNPPPPIPPRTPGPPHIPPRSAGGFAARATDSAFVRRFAMPAQQFIFADGASGRLLLLAAVVALVWANSPWSAQYEALWRHHVAIDLGAVHADEDLRHWVNDGLMTLFFFLVTLEVKREMVSGALSTRARATLPVAAALGGMVVPAAIFVAFNAGGAVHGWGIPMATDIAFAVGALAILGRKTPTALLIFLLTLAVVDDIGAIAVIAVFYTEQVHLGAVAAMAALIALVIAAQRLGVRAIPVYWAIGIALWFATLESGIHATLAGVFLAALTPSRPYVPLDRFAASAPALVARVARAAALTEGGADDGHDQVDAALGELETLVVETESPLERLERMILPWTGYMVLPLFALANAGVSLSPHALEAALDSNVARGVFFGLWLGKPIGILGASWLAIRLGFAAAPEGLRWPDLAAVACLAGIGFSVSIFITDLAYPGSVLAEQAKAGILAATTLAALTAWPLFRLQRRR